MITKRTLKMLQVMKRNVAALPPDTRVQLTVAQMRALYESAAACQDKMSSTELAVCQRMGIL